MLALGLARLVSIGEVLSFSNRFYRDTLLRKVASKAEVGAFETKLRFFSQWREARDLACKRESRLLALARLLDAHLQHSCLLRWRSANFFSKKWLKQIKYSKTAQAIAEARQNIEAIKRVGV